MDGRVDRISIYERVARDDELCHITVSGERQASAYENEGAQCDKHSEADRSDRLQAAQQLQHSDRVYEHPPTGDLGVRRP